jgi:hypothetical protein
MSAMKSIAWIMVAVVDKVKPVESDWTGTGLH